MTNTSNKPSDLVLWGHSTADYQEMFALNDDDLKKKIIDCYPGASSFNAEITEKHGHVVSVDTLYEMDKTALTHYLDKVSETMQKKLEQNKEKFIWSNKTTLNELIKTRQQGIKKFLSDFEKGQKEKRYVGDKMKWLPFANRTFQLALCSHFLFGYRDHFDLNDHITVIRELSRIADEIRIFPLIDSQGEISSLVGPILLALQQQQVGVEVREVPYQFQKKGNAMMRIWAQSCHL